MFIALFSDERPTDSIDLVIAKAEIIGASAVRNILPISPVFHRLSQKFSRKWLNDYGIVSSDPRHIYIDQTFLTFSSNCTISRQEYC